MKLIEESAVKVGQQWMIPYPWKRNPEDLPDNEEQVKKFLESTERKLLKNPQKAAAYNDKMKEIEEVKFTRKLTESEMEDYKGPVITFQIMRKVQAHLYASCSTHRQVTRVTD